MLALFSSSIFLLGSSGTHIGFCLDGRSELGGLTLGLGLLFLGRGLLIHVDLFFTKYQNPKDKSMGCGRKKHRGNARCEEVAEIDG